MSSSLFSLLAQSNTGSDWNWFLIFIIFVIILSIALILQAVFSKKDADELAVHEAETPHEAEPPQDQAEEALAAAVEPLHEPEPEPEPAPAVAAAAVVAQQSEPEPQPEPQETAVPTRAAPAISLEPDDLKKIEGIGPKVSGLLNEHGITTFAQLADAAVDKLDEILDANKLQMMDPGSWPQQAKLAAAGDWDALQKLQDELKGGR